MSTLPLPTNIESNPKVKAVFDDIRQTRQSDFINNMWHYLAFDPDLLESTWREVKAVMASPSSLDPLTKEMIYIAVSVTNACISKGSSEKALSTPPSVLLKVKCFSTIVAPSVTAATETPIPIV